MNKFFIKIILSLIITLSLISFSSCGVANKNMSRVERSFSKIDTSYGMRNISLKVFNNSIWNMNISFPKKSQSKKTLVIALHWRGGGNAYKEFSKCLVQPGMEELNAIIITPDAEFLKWTNKYNEDKIIRLVKLAIQYWNINPDKVVIMGYSNGAIGSWYFTEHYPSIFHAAIPIAGMYHVEEKIDAPFYVIHSKKDEVFGLKKTEFFINQAKEKGMNIKFVVLPNYTHYDACSYKDELKNATKWLIKVLGAI